MARSTPTNDTASVIALRRRRDVLKGSGTHSLSTGEVIRTGRPGSYFYWTPNGQPATDAQAIAAGFEVE